MHTVYLILCDKRDYFYKIVTKFILSVFIYIQTMCRYIWQKCELTEIKKTGPMFICQLSFGINSTYKMGIKSRSILMERT